MQLIACWYHNIGPFLHRPVGLHFFNGAYLIKANIGSGKSFLFFDGPMFGLYKYSRRPMLHRQAKEGQVQVLFEHLGQTYLVCRTITMTKAGGDSVVTRLYMIQNAKFKMQDDIYTEVLNWNVESLESLLKTEIEEIPFKSGVELEATLASLLPPQEVIESSSILLQESDNIFEMTAGERITIFKHLFGLLGIDEAKDILADKKKQIIAQKELLANTSQINSQFRSLIAGFLSNIEQFNNLAQDISPKISCSRYDDLVLTRESLQIEDFQRSQTELDTKQLGIHLQQDRDSLVAQQSQQQQRQQQQQSLQRQVQELQIQQQSLVSQKISLQQSMSTIDTSKTQQLQQEKQYLLSQIQLLSEKHSYHGFVSLGYMVTSLTEAVRTIQLKIQEAELLKAKIAQQEIDKERYLQQQQEIIGQKNRLTHQIAELESASKKGEVYICENCKHENCIPGTHNEMLTKQLHHLTGEYQRIEQQETEIIQKLQSLNLQTTEKNQLENIKNIFLSVARKQILEDGTQSQNLQEQVQQLDRQLGQYQADLDRLTKFQQDLIRIEIQQEETEKQLYQKNNELHIFESETKDNEGKEFQSEIQKREQLFKLLDQINHADMRIYELVFHSREQLIKVKQLKEQEQIVGDLYAIYSKELMLVVLQDFLPSLELAINANLTQVVDYQIKFELIKKSSDKLELEIFVIDEKGQRSVKSLSGGQKTVLKLVRILSVATMMKSEFLFMDETINNLDTDAIAKVAELIKNFVAYHDMKYYVVTHAPQIQEMGIWTKTIEIAN